MGNCCSVQFSFENILIRGWDSIVGQANYVCKLRQTLPTLSAALDELKAQRNDVQRKVDLAEQRRLTSCLSSYKFGKRVAEKLEDIKDHLNKGAFEEVAESQPTASVVLRPDERPIALESTIDEIWSCIMDKDVGIIGLYGIGGVGKTTLLNQINNKFSTTPEGFNVIIWALVSKDYNVGKIQDRIGGKIGFSDESWKNKSVYQKAEDIYGVLHNKKFVVLLDDLWERVDLNKVGIPKPSQENGSKLIFTTRSFEVCGEMEARKRIKVECLKPEEAWKLFLDKVGDETLNSHPDIPKLAQQVVKECGGLPLALITIGRAMACKTTPGEWKYAIEKLKRSALPKMEKETLVEYWFCEGLLNEFDRIREAEMQGDHIINSLLGACLLERAGKSHHGDECVKMHDLIRDMCLSIACELQAQEKNVFVKAGAQLLKMPDVKAWEGAKRMSVMQNRIQVLGETPKCPNLRTLFLSHNKLKVISDGFFQFIPHLTVLDLSENRDLKALPEGISQLISLECLDLSSTNVAELPIELKSLTKLKMLDLSDTDDLRKIPQHLISSLFKLQIFRIWCRECRQYPQEEDNVLDEDNNEKLIEELKSLQHLNILRLPLIQSMSDLQRFLSLHSLRCCTEALDLRGFTETNVFNVLCFENMERLERLDIMDCGNIEELKMENLHTRVSLHGNYTSHFHTLREVEISCCDKLRDVTWLILAPNLRSLVLWECAKMEEILSEGKVGEVADVVGIPYPTPFLKLETLYLHDLPELKSICWHALPFSCLKCISIGYCPKLKKLPLNTDSAKGNHITIQGSQDWLAELEWENEATRHAFLPSFKSF
ncbi:hypothetical protein V6N13_093941 [Hibiscus sabdariffa]